MHLHGSLREYILSSARTSVRVKLGLFNAKICNENRCYIHRLIYQLNEQDLRYCANRSLLTQSFNIVNAPLQLFCYSPKSGSQV